MAGKTVEDLKTLLADLTERRRKEAYWASATGAYADSNIAKLAQVDRAIQALEAVIAEGKDEPEDTETSSGRVGFV